MGCNPPGSSFHRISQIRILEWVAISFSRESFWPWRDWTHVSCLGRRILYHCLTWESQNYIKEYQKKKYQGRLANDFFRQKKKKEKMKGKQEIAGWRKNGKKRELKRTYDGCREGGSQSLFRDVTDTNPIILHWTSFVHSSRKSFFSWSWILWLYKVKILMVQIYPSRFSYLIYFNW